jgi:hypothetical protein
MERLTKREKASLNSETCSSVRESACKDEYQHMVSEYVAWRAGRCIVMFVEVGLSRRNLDGERGRRTIFVVSWWS